VLHFCRLWLHLKFLLTLTPQPWWEVMWNVILGNCILTFLGSNVVEYNFGCFSIGVFCKYFQVVMITGASSGLGESLAHCFYKAGCRVILAARRQNELERVRSDLLAMHVVSFGLWHSEHDVHHLAILIFMYIKIKNKQCCSLAAFNLVEFCTSVVKCNHLNWTQPA
jgi:hypothetical protein